MTILVNLYDLRQNHLNIVNTIIQTIDNSVQIILIIKISKNWKRTLCVISVAASQTRMGARKKPQNSKSTLFFSESSAVLKCDLGHKVWIRWANFEFKEHLHLWEHLPPSLTQSAFLPLRALPSLLQSPRCVKCHLCVKSVSGAALINDGSLENAPPKFPMPSFAIWSKRK